MRATFMVLVAIAPMAACSRTGVTAPLAPVTAPALRMIVVDGVAMSLAGIGAADIEEVDVMIKGPAATALHAAERRCPPIIIRTRPTSFRDIDSTQRVNDRTPQ